MARVDLYSPMQAFSNTDRLLTDRYGYNVQNNEMRFRDYFVLMRPVKIRTAQHNAAILAIAEVFL